LFGTLAQRFLKSNHDAGVPLSFFGIAVCMPGGQVMDDGVKHLLLQRSSYLGTLQEFPFAICKSTSLFKKALKSQRIGA
jgi:hypothetical protein